MFGFSPLGAAPLANDEAPAVHVLVPFTPPAAVVIGRDTSKARITGRP
jgi:hypothetical protein